MKQQILFIHGASAYSDYNTFLRHLRTVEINDPLGLVEKKRWKHSLKEELGEGYEVYTPTMPNSSNAHYQEWKIWFERYLTFLHDGVILIGHSLGGYFLVKYLTENVISVQVQAIYLIAAPFEPDDFEGENGGDFDFDTSTLKNLSLQTQKVCIFHSEDDPVVPYAHAKKFLQAMPSAKLCSFMDRGHFLQEEFRELIVSIKELAAKTKCTTS